MPIIDVEIVVDEGEPLAPGLAGGLADAIGPLLGSAPGGTWVRLRALPRSSYAESGGGPAPDVRPVFVSVLRRTWPEPPSMTGQVQRITEAVARLCGRPADNVHVLHEAPALGRLAFGGRIVGS